MVERRMVSVDTPSAAQFAELTAFARDLDEAEDALALALTYVEPRSGREERLRKHLISAAVIAYWRCFPGLNLRTELTEDRDWIETLESVHKASKEWRNKMIAHTDSAMKRSLAFVQLTKSDDTIACSPAVGISIEVDAPEVDVNQFHDLVVFVADRVASMRNTIGAQLATELSPGDLAKLWDRPDVEIGPDSEAISWEPGKTRLRKSVHLSFPVEIPGAPTKP
jgi:hypothetical protein